MAANPPAKVADAMALGVLFAEEVKAKIAAIPIPIKGRANRIRNAGPILDGLAMGNYASILRPKWQIRLFRYRYRGNRHSGVERSATQHSTMRDFLEEGSKVALNRL